MMTKKDVIVNVAYYAGTKTTETMLAAGQALLHEYINAINREYGGNKFVVIGDDIIDSANRNVFVTTKIPSLSDNIRVVFKVNNANTGAAYFNMQVYLAVPDSTDMIYNVKIEGQAVYTYVVNDKKYYIDLQTTIAYDGDFFFLNRVGNLEGFIATPLVGNKRKVMVQISSTANNCRLIDPDSYDATSFMDYNMSSKVIDNSVIIENVFYKVGLSTNKIAGTIDDIVLVWSDDFNSRTFSSIGNITIAAGGKQYSKLQGPFWYLEG